jgi:hypothetical protein
MDKQIIKEKKLIYLFSKLEKLRKNNVHLALIIDTFINNKNQYLDLIQISASIGKIDIDCSPERLKEVIDNIEVNDFFANYDIYKSIDHPFNLRKDYYNNLSELSNYSDKLEQLIISFLNKKEESCEKCTVLIHILFETIITRNIEYLRLIAKPKERATLLGLKAQVNGDKFSKEDYELYNSFIEQTSTEFNEILQVLLYKVADFLSLNYNPDVDKFVNQKLGNKKYYLDSSLILRLLGLNNEVRESRSKRLIDLLSKIEGVHFFVHGDTLAESQDRINRLIDESLPLLKHSTKNLKTIEKRTGKGSNTVDLYTRMKIQGEVSNPQDFQLYFSNITNILKKKLGANKISIDNERISIDKSKFNDLKNKLETTDKSQFRIKHISRLLAHIENKRGANNYNLFDIEYWLLTTDGKTLSIDSELLELEDNKIKSSCILPSELLRLIESAGEIKGEYIEVFKKYMMYSNIYREDYEKNESESIERILTLAENAAKSNYDIDFYLDNLFDKYSLEEIAKRMSKFKQIEDREKVIVDLFLEANDSFFESKYVRLAQAEIKRLSLLSTISYSILCFTIPFLVLLYLGSVLINKDFVWSDPLTYINQENFSKLEFLIAVIEGLIIYGSIWIYKKHRQGFKNWFIKMFKTKI